MKTFTFRIYGLILLCAIFFSSKTKAQEFSCDFKTPKNGHLQEKEGGSLFCSEIERYIPGYITPLAQSRILTVNLTFFVMCNGGDTMRDPFSGNTLDLNRLQYWIDTYYNPKLANIPPPNVANPNPTLEQTDSRIRLKAKEVIYLNSPAATYSTHTDGLNFFLPKINAKWPDGMGNSIAVFLGNTTSTGGISGGMGSWTSDAQTKWFTMYGRNWSAFLSESTFLHELGHALGLAHTFYSYTTYNDADGIDDTPDDMGYCLTTGTTATCPNNLMGYVNSDPNWGYLSPKQIAIMRMNIENNLHDRFADGTPYLNSFTQVLADCKKSAGVPDLQITANETWNKAVVLDRNLVVKSGKTLTIQCKVSMPEDGKIKVEPGARLIIDNGYITNSCKALWSGIEVEGVYTATQALSGGIYQQGYLEMKNNAVIENAQTGVKLLNGGIIIATNSEFRNNAQGIYFGTYTNKNTSGTIIANISKFDYCNFKTTRILNENATFSHFIALDGVWLNKFTGNIFENTRADLTNTSEPLGTGISSLYSILQIRSSCNSLASPCPEANIIFNEFRNLHVGIRISDYFTTDIHENKFIDCAYGILSESSYDVDITSNRIWVGACSSPGLRPEYGIMLNGECYGMNVSKNKIYKSSGANAQSTTGILVRGTGANNNTVSGNTLTDLTYGNVSININRSSSNTGIGLLYTCNSNYNTGDDFYVTYETGFQPSSGIRYYQGSSNSSAGNIFTNDGMLTETDFRIDVSNGIYYYWDSGTKKKPLYYTTSRITLPATAATAVNCNPGLGGSASKTSNMNEYQEQFVLIKKQYDALKSIQQTGNTSAQELASIIAKEGVKITKELAQQINQSDEQSVMQILDMLLADLQLEKDLLIRDAINTLYSDEEILPETSYSEWQSKREHPSTELNFILQNITRGIISPEDEERLNTIPSRYLLDEQQTLNWKHLNDFYILLKEWINQGYTLDHLTNEAINLLREKANEKTDFHGNILARNLMNTYYESQYTPIVFIPQGGTEISMSSTEKQLEKPASIVISPNPSNQNMNVQWKQRGENHPKSLSVTNTLGIELLHIDHVTGNETNLDVSQLTNGVYLLTLSSEDKSKIETIHFVVQH